MSTELTTEPDEKKQKWMKMEIINLCKYENTHVGYGCNKHNRD